MVRPHQPQQALVPEYTSGAPPIMVAGNVSHSVAFWPEAAAAERSVLSVLGDADHVRFWLGSDLPYSAEAAQVAPPCVYSALTGVRVRNVELALATTREHSPVDGHLVFDPEHGPGEYEVYSHCSEHDHQPSDLAWRTAIPHASAVTSMPAALLIRREARNAILGPAWHEPPYGGYGASRRSLGNVRARLLVTAADARARAVRALIPWRRRHRPLGTQIYLYHEKGSAQHGAPRSYGDGSYRYYVKEAGRVENVALLVDGRESAEVLFEPTHGPGEYDLYYLPHQTKWQTYDARDDAHGTSYEAYQPTFDEAWHRVHARSAARLPVVRVFDVQARTHSDRFGDMERPATSDELASMLSSAVMGTKAAAKAASVTAAPRARRRLRVPGGDTRAPPSRTPRWHLFPESRAHVLRTMGKTLDPRLGPACICSLRRPLFPQVRAASSLNGGQDVDLPVGSTPRRAWESSMFGRWASSRRRRMTCACSTAASPLPAGTRRAPTLLRAAPRPPRPRLLRRSTVPELWPEIWSEIWSEIWPMPTLPRAPVRGAPAPGAPAPAAAAAAAVRVRPSWRP